MSERLVNIVMITSLFVITGGLHTDGFMDTVDGLAGGRTKEDVLRDNEGQPCRGPRRSGRMSSGAR